VETCFGSAGTRKGVDLIVGPTWQRRERRNAVDGLRKLEEEAPFGKYAMAAQAQWAEWTERAHDGLRAKRPVLLGAGPDGPELEEKLFPNKI
jgi:predicted nicotinamide N-methyase